MFRSEKLVRITAQVPEPFISSATAVLTQFKLLHLIRIDETYLGHLGYAAETDGNLLKEYEALFGEVEGTIDTLQARPPGIVPGQRVLPEERVIPEKEVYKVRERLAAIRKEVESTLGELGTAEETLREKKTLVDRFKLLPGDLDLTRLSGRTFVCWMIGLAPAQGLEPLEESLSQVHHAIIELGSAKEQSEILVFGLMKDRHVLERALKGALFEPIDIPPKATGTVDALIRDLQSAIITLEEKVRSLSGQRETLRQLFAQEILTLRERIIAARQILSARRLFGKIDTSYLISGWIPERLFTALGEELAQVTEGQVIFEKVAPEDLREVREGIVKIPILFNNPILISPFEKLTSLYGTPCYREVEPTVLFALSFLLLFGMMFGDVGQGGVLFAVGYIIFRRLYKYMDYGIILMECGLSSVLFGFLYGTVFGLETVIPALWFRPMDSIPYFIKVSLSLGIVLVSLGLVLNLVNALRLKDYENLLSAGGLAGALLYWMSAGLAMKYFLTGQVEPTELHLLAWTAAGLMTLIVVHRPIYRLIVRKEHPGRILRRAGLLTELMESIVELFDDLIRFTANTVSFIRVAAFALSHAALFAAVFSMADVLAHEKAGSFSYWLVVGAGNIIIILLEGLVVSIQTVRLEYYEFFGKFFRGGGERFIPIDKELRSEETRV